MFKGMIARPSFSFFLGVGLVALTLIVPASGWTQNLSTLSSIDLKEPGALVPAKDWLGKKRARVALTFDRFRQSPLIDDVEPASIALAPRAAGAIPAVPFYDPLIAGLLTEVTTSTLYSLVGGLSGEWPVLVGGQPYTFTTRHSHSGEPLAKATQYVYEYLQARCYDVYYHEYQMPDNGPILRNVIGEKQGLVHPDQIFLFTAHLDSRAVEPPHDPAPGADDNGTGVAALLLAAELLSDVDFAYTTRIVFFTGEEQSMVGSGQYANWAASNGDDIVGVLNLDMIGWDAIDGPDIDLHSCVHYYCTPAVSDASDALAAFFVAVVDVYGFDLLPEIISGENTLSRSDHYSFWLHNYPAILAIEDYYHPSGTLHDFSPYYHTAGDRVDTLNLDYFCEYARAAIAAFAHLGRPMSSLGGTVVAADGAVPLNATVTVLGQEGVFSDTSDASGSYEIILPTGFYSATASADGYYPQTITQVAVLTGTVVLPGAVKVLDFALESLPLYHVDLLGQTVRFGDAGDNVTHTVTLVNTGALSDTYNLALSSSGWTAVLPFTRSALLFSQQQVVVPLVVTISPDAALGESDQVTLTVTSVYSPTHTDHIVLHTGVSAPIYLPLVARNF